MEMPSGRRLALLLGVSSYDDEQALPALRTPIQDVESVSDVLHDSEICRFNDVAILRNPKRQEMQKAMEELLIEKAESDDLLLIYYSGHGKLGKSGLHLCPKDTKGSKLRSTAVPISWIREIIDESCGNQIVLILDCCYSGQAKAGLKGDISSMLTDQFSRGRGKFIITSSSGFEVSMEQPNDNNSLFTKWFLNGLTTGSADFNNDGVITLEEIYRYTRDRVRKENPLQNPEHFAFTDSPGDVILAETRMNAERVSIIEPEEKAPLMVAAEHFANNQVVPFIGPGIYGSGPLGNFAISNHLARKAGLTTGQSYPMVTAAEFLQRIKGDWRGELLDELRVFLENGASQTQAAQLHDLIVKMKTPSLVISTTYDMYLESLLEQAGKPYLIVSHILRSEDRDPDGRIVAIRSGSKPDIRVCYTDELVIDDEPGIIIYKILGSPFLNDLPLLEAEGMDTVIMTETDHLDFLMRLENERTKIPNAFSVFMKRKFLMFLGYNLDIWHYRLVLHVFQKCFQRRGHKKPISIQQSTSNYEEIWWKRLDPDVIHSDLGTFSQFVTQALREKI